MAMAIRGTTHPHTRTGDSYSRACIGGGDWTWGSADGSMEIGGLGRERERETVYRINIALLYYCVEGEGAYNNMRGDVGVVLRVND